MGGGGGGRVEGHESGWERRSKAGACVMTLADVLALPIFVDWLKPPTNKQTKVAYPSYNIQCLDSPPFFSHVSSNSASENVVLCFKRYSTGGVYKTVTGVTECSRW